MKEQHEHIDGFFREKLFNFSPAPPAIVWKKLEREINQDKKKPIIPLYMKVAAGFLLLAGIAGLLWKQNLNSSSTQVANNSTVQETLPNLSHDEIVISKNKIETANTNLSAAVSENTKNKSQKSEITVTQQVAEIVYSESPDENISSNNVVKSDTLQNQIISEVILAQEDDKNVTYNFQQDSMQPSRQVTLSEKPLPNIIDAYLVEDAQKKHKSLKWAAGGQFGPQYSYRDINANKASTEFYNSVESPVMAYAGGLNIQLEATKRLTVQAGIYYSKIGIERTFVINGNVDMPKTDGWGGDHFDRQSTLPTTSDLEESSQEINTFAYNEIQDIDYTIASNGAPGDYNAEQYLEYIEIPLIVRYRVYDHKLGINILGGISTDLLIGSSVHETGPNNYEINKEAAGINKTNYSGSVGFGIEYHLSKKIIFNIEPVYKYYFSSMYEDSKIDVHPYSVGIMTGINYKF